MADTVQRLGVEFFGQINEKSITDAVDKIKKKFEGIKLADLAPGLSANLGSLADALGKSTASLSKLGVVAAEVGTKVSQEYRGATTAVSGLTSETRKLITLTEQLATTFAKIDFTNMIKPDQMEMFRSKFAAINKQVDLFTSQLAKVAKPEFMGIQQEAMAMSKQIDAAMKSLVQDPKSANAPARIQEIINMLRQLKSMGGSALSSEFKAGAESLQEFSIKANMSTQAISKLGLGLIELQKAKSLLSQQINNVKLQFDNIDKTTGHYDATVTKLNRRLLDLMKTEQSVNSVINSIKKDLAETVPVIGRLESGFNLIHILDKINPPEIHRTAEAWKKSAENLSLYMKELSAVMHIRYAGSEKEILGKSKAIETQLAEIQTLRRDPTTTKTQIDSAIAGVQKLINEYAILERGMLGEAIAKTTASLRSFNIETGMGYDKIRKMAIGLLEWEKVAELLRNQVAQLYAQYKGLGPVTDANREQAKRISSEWDKATKTLDAVSQQMRVLHGATADAARGLRMYWEGFAPMLKSQAAWLTGGALLFGVMYKIQDAVKNYLTFEDKLNRIKVIGNGTSKQIEILKNEIFSLSEATGQTTVQLSEAAFYLVKYGLSIDQVNKALPSLVRLTEVAGGTIEENAKGVIALLNSYNMAYTQTDKLANALTVTLNQSKLEMSELSNILSIVASSYSQFNQPIEQVLGLAAAMSNLGVVPSTIATSLRNFLAMLAQIETPTERFSDNIMKKVTNAMGSHAKAVAALHPAYNTISEILEVFKKSMISVSDLYAGANIRVASGTAAMLSAKDSMNLLTDAITTQIVMSEQFLKVTGSATTQLKALSSTLDTFIAKLLGGGTAQGLAGIISLLKNFLVVVGDLHTGIKGIILRIAEFGAVLLFAAGTLKIFNYTLLSTLSLKMMDVSWIMRVITTPWLKWVAIIIAVIAGINLLSRAYNTVAGSMEDNINVLKESYKNKILELNADEEKLKQNKALIAANASEKSVIEEKNKVLEEQVRLKRESAEEDRIAIMKAMEKSIEALHGPQLTPGAEAVLGAGGGAGLGPFDSDIYAPLSGTQRFDVLEGKSGLYNQFLSMIELSKKEDTAMFPLFTEMRRIFGQRKQVMDSLGEPPIRKPGMDFVRRMAELEAEDKAIRLKNDAVSESQTIESDLISTREKLLAIQKEIDEAGYKPEKEEELKIKRQEAVNKITELSLRHVEAIKKETTATIEYETTLKKLAIDNETITLNRERSLKVEAEISKITLEQNDVKRQLLSTDIKTGEYQTLSAKRVQLDNQLAEKKIELTKEGFAEAERYYNIQDTLIEQSVANKSLEIEQSLILSSREKEVQKLQVERLGLMAKIHNVLEKITKSEQEVGVDKLKKEELQNIYKDLNHELDLVNKKIKDSKEKQRTFWQAITEYIAEAEEATKSFSYNMGKAFTDQVESSFADFGKAMVYQNADTIKELRGQRDEDLGNIKDKYDEELLALEDSLANGKVTYFDYYEQLQDLNDKYHKDVKSSQDQFEKNMKDSLVTISSLWEKFWRAMIDAAINMMAQQAVSGIFKSIGGLFTPASTSTGWAQSAGGGLNTGTTPLVTNFSLPKTVRADNSLGVRTSDYANRTGESQGRDINIINVVDPSSIPTLSPDDVVNIISYNVAQRGQIYKTITLAR